MTSDRFWGYSDEDESDFDLNDYFEKSHHSHSGGNNMGLLSSLVGVACGVVFVLLIVYCCCCRKRRNAGRVLTSANPPPPPPAANTLPAAAYPRQEYVTQPVSPYPHNATIQTSPAPPVTHYPAAGYPAPAPYPTGYPGSNPPYPTGNPPYPAANQAYPAANPAPYPVYPAHPVPEMFPPAPTAPQMDMHALPPSYDQAVGEKHPPYNPHVR